MSLLEGLFLSRTVASQTTETTYRSSLSLGLQKQEERKLAKRNHWPQSPSVLPMWAYGCVCLSFASLHGYCGERDLQE